MIGDGGLGSHGLGSDSRYEILPALWKPWAPFRAQLIRNAAVGATSVRIRTGTVFDTLSLPFYAILGTEFITVTSNDLGLLTLEAPLGEPHFADGWLIQSTIRVVVGSKEHTGMAQGLQDKEASPEGEVEATWWVLVPDSALDEWTPTMDPPAEFTLYSNETGEWLPFFGGSMGVFEDEPQQGGGHKLFYTGRGAYTWLHADGWSRSRKWTAYTAEHVVMQDARNELCSTHISTSNEHVIDGGTSFPTEIEAKSKSPRQLFDDAAGMGDFGPLDWYIRTDIDGNHKLWVLRRERQPTVKIPITSLKLPTRFRWDVENQRTKIVVEFKDGVVELTQPGSTVIRWRYLQLSSNIDNYDLAYQVVKQYLAWSNTLDAISSGQLIVEFPKPIYAADGVTEITHHLLRAGTLIDVVGYEPGGELTLGSFQLRQLDRDHVEHTLGLNCGPVIEDDLSFASQFIAREIKRLGSPSSPLQPFNIAPPEGVPVPVASGAASVGANGKIGYAKLADEADIETMYYGLTGGGNDIDIEEGRNLDIPIDVSMLIRGFHLMARDHPPGPCSIHVDVTVGHEGSYPAAGSPIGTGVGITNSNEIWERYGEDALTSVIPGDHLTFEISGVAGAKFGTIGILYQRLAGSARAPATGGPTIVSSTASRDDQNQTTFTVVTNRPCTIQIDFGKDSSYGASTHETENAGLPTGTNYTSTVTHLGLPSPAHWRAKVWDRDRNTNTTSDQTL